MADWNELYPLDLRTEFDNIVLGFMGETPIGRPFILRRMRRDSNDNLVPCTCVHDLTREPDRDRPCPYCLGAGNLWDEELISAYKVVAAAPGGSNAAANYQKMESGATYAPAARFFIPWNVAPRMADRIVEIELDSGGNAVTPYNRVAIYEFMLVRAMRGQNAKIEFWACNGQRMGPATQGYVG